MTPEYKVSKKDIPWIEETILDAHSYGHFKVTNMLEQVLEKMMLNNGE